MNDENDRLADLRRRLSSKAENEPMLLAYALKKWRERMPTAPEAILSCRSGDLWRIGLVRTPKDGPTFAAETSRIAETFRLSLAGLTDLIRFAQIAAKLQQTGQDAILKAARADDSDSDQT
jgi:hypothetical protein